MRLIIKARKMPIGTISHGRKKIAEGRWVLIPKGRRKKTLASEHDIQQVRQMFKRQASGEGREQVITSKHDLDLILTQTTFSMISAGANPNEKLTPRQAKARHGKLLADLKKSGYMYTQGFGQYGAPEDSIFVMTHDANKREMIALGGKYNQESVLFVENGRSQLIGATEDKGKVMMAGTGYSYVPDAEDYYTEFEIAGEKIKFTMNLRDIAKALVRMVVRLCKRQAS